MSISSGMGGATPNGNSGEPAVSGDNRAVRFVAYSSYASNLVRGDSNGVRDIFAWFRPTNRVPRALRSGRLQRVSFGPNGQANGESSNPAVDGSMVNRPHCVAFQSTATNLSSRDATPDSDIFVRDLRRKRTILISNGISGPAVNPSIAGNCKKVLFESGGKVYWSRVGAGAPKSLGTGTEPRFSRDGKSITFVRGGNVVFRHGRLKRTLGPGGAPRVSDYATSHGWAVAYNSGGNVKVGIINGGRKSIQTAARNAVVGGVTSRAAHRGIVVWARSHALYYLNRNTGNSDDLAYGHSNITEIDASARANLIAFAATGGENFIDARGNRTKSVYVKWLPK
ncbi:MAG: PD40 domain-containing protein [Thermoleophilaceae bacterium]|nr:PD40 domain-containing protein [Thermoleophilaceae bacterium]